ncbi:hypothetical protein HHI36_016407 [Cryptolaemus montrouzieri]|uniref:Cytochrome P450 n=1 Tax=Cryptolaemus montrouzieri TaxID=559131 RepID=A0ABD2NJL5_9CUCU
MEKILSSVDHSTKGFFYDALRPWLGTGLLTSSGRKWHNRRKMLTPTYHFTILQKFLKVFNTQSRIFLETLKENVNKEVNVVPMVTGFTLDSICETAMGSSLNSMEDGEKYRQSVYDFGEIVVKRIKETWLMIEILFRFTTTYWRQRKIVSFLHKFSQNVIQEKKKYYSDNPNGSNSVSGKRQLAMLDLLVLAQKQNAEIDDEGVREEVDTFMFEGHDTTSMSLCFSLMLLANNKHCQDSIYEEIHSVFGDDDREATYGDLQELRYLERCIKESLRLYPSVPLINRRVSSDVETKSGRVIPKGCNVVFQIYDTHRDEKIYPEPEKFDPDRFLLENTMNRHPYAYIPFSAGPRNCIGQKFAMMEMKCLLSEIIRNYILEPIDSPNTITLISDIVIRPRGPIRVKFIPRK